METARSPSKSENFCKRARIIGRTAAESMAATTCAPLPPPLTLG
jgi:hypothetical protein